MKGWLKPKVFFQVPLINLLHFLDKEFEVLTEDLNNWNTATIFSVHSKAISYFVSIQPFVWLSQYSYKNSVIK